MGREVRDKFKPGVDEEGVYLHVFNHCVENRENDFPLGDVEKFKFLQHLKRTLTLYSIECLSAVVMSNHYHLILYIPKKTFSIEEMAARIIKFKKGKVLASPQDFYTQRRHEISNDLSFLMKEIQRGFTCWFNKTCKFKRRGTLWEQRFKCSKLADSQALATCLKYVELNPVRADIVDDPADYHFSTYGIWQQSGSHPYKESFKKHMISALKIYLEKESLKGLENYFRERFAVICTSESGADKSEVTLAVKNVGKSRKNPLLVRSRFWIDSMVLGSRVVLEEHVADFWGDERAQRKKFGQVFEEAGVEILSMRQLMVDVN